MEGPFKDRYNNHTKSFRKRKYKLDTEFSKLIWAVKAKGEKLYYKLAYLPWVFGLDRCFPECPDYSQLVPYNIRSTTRTISIFLIKN